MLLAAAASAATEPTGAARLGAGIAATVRSLRQNPLFGKIVAVDPELLLPYLLDRRGRSQEAILDLVEQTIVSGQQDGSVRDADPRLMARSIVLAVYGVTISADTMADDTISVHALCDELRLLVERYAAR